MIIDEYAKGLFQVGGGTYAYVQPNGYWGQSNAGLISDGGQSMLVDTLMDLRLTDEMLTVMADAVPAASKIDVLVNSHADIDHTYGNQLVKGARIVASQASASEFFKVTPEYLVDIITNDHSEGGRYIAEKMGSHLFDYSRIVLTPPTETFDRQKTIMVGDKEVRLLAVGPAHTAGDVIVHSVQDRVVFTGDLLFLGVHPAIWAGSVEGWIDACDTMLSLDVDTFVSGHGPVTDKNGVRTFRAYLVEIRAETRKRFEAGLSVEEAAFDIAWSPPFDEWLSPERVVGCVNYLYRSWGSTDTIDDFVGVFAALSRYAKRKRATGAEHVHTASCGHAH
ncbi:MBL fold metallo-hydrolase [Sphingomonas sp.]|uniref:MBL fold metallo-hydrolase n=1 Tax=Sphingomonas sp. TaxID=28214 RepID=UPI0035BBC242